MVVHFVKDDGDICIEKIHLHGKNDNENICLYGGVDGQNCENLCFCGEKFDI